MGDSEADNTVSRGWAVLTKITRATHPRLVVAVCVAALTVLLGGSLSGQQIAGRILSFPTRSNYSGTRICRIDSSDLHQGLLELRDGSPLKQCRCSV